MVDPRVVFGALMGAIVWNLVTWLARHSLVQLACADRRAGRRRHREGRARARSCGPASARPRAAIVLSPLIGLHARAAADADRLVAVRARHALRGRRAASAACSSCPPRSTRSATAATTRRRPWASSRCCSTRRGISAASSTCRSGSSSPARPPWVWGRCSAAGASCKTMGSRITRLTPVQGFCAETGGAITLFLRDLARHSGLDHPHHHRRDRRRRRGAPGLGGALERHHQHRGRLGHHHAGGRAGGGGVLLGGGSARLIAGRAPLCPPSFVASAPVMSADGGHKACPPYAAPCLGSPHCHTASILFTARRMHQLRLSMRIQSALIATGSRLRERSSLRQP